MKQSTEWQYGGAVIKFLGVSHTDQTVKHSEVFTVCSQETYLGLLSSGEAVTSQWFSRQWCVWCWTMFLVSCSLFFFIEANSIFFSRELIGSWPNCVLGRNCWASIMHVMMKERRWRSLSSVVSQGFCCFIEVFQCNMKQQITMSQSCSGIHSVIWRGCGSGCS